MLDAENIFGDGATVPGEPQTVNQEQEKAAAAQAAAAGGPGKKLLD